MLPLVSVTNAVPLQAPLVNTPLPGSLAAHVPYDNVAPSVSNAQVDNNSLASGAVAAEAEQEAAAAQQEASAQDFASSSIGGTSEQNASVQAAFLAQLLAQDGSPETGSVLIQYEKLIALGNVKYKPSNALKPTAEPADAFGRILQHEHQNTTHVQAAPPLEPTTHEAPSSPTVETAPAPASASPPGSDAAVTHAAPPAPGFHAYSATMHTVNAAPATATEVA